MPTPIEIADSLEPDLRAAFLAVVDAVAQAVPTSVLKDLLERGDIVGIVNAFETVVAASLTFPISTTLTSVYGSLVTQPFQQAVRGYGLSASFSLISQLVLDQVRQNAANLIVGIGQDTILSIRTIVERNFLEGMGSSYAARIIRSMVGLLPSHALAVARYHEGLADIPEDRRAHLTATYANRLLNYRAENISRTETIRASYAGQYAGWNQMVKEGILQPHRTHVVWDVTEDDRLCPWCAVMDGVEVSLGQLFMSTTKGFPNGKPALVTPGSLRLRRGPIKPDPYSQPRDPQGRYLPYFKRDTRDELDGKVVTLKKPYIVLHPPLHPQCRCSLHLRFDD